MSNEAKAITIDQYGASLVAVNFRSGSSIAHEAVHIKNAIWRYIGYEPQRDNDEVDAYLVTYIYIAKSWKFIISTIKQPIKVAFFLS